jgi:hypothetical protein
MSENIKKAFQDQQAHTIVSEIPSGFPLLATYNFTTGAMGPREVQEIAYGMGHCM